MNKYRSQWREVRRSEMLQPMDREPDNRWQYAVFYAVTIPLGIYGASLWIGG